MHVIVELYGDLKRVLGTQSVELSLDGSVRVEDIINFLREKNASKFGSEAFEILVNGTNVRGLMGVKTELKDGDVVSLIPIVEGG